MASPARLLALLFAWSVCAQQFPALISPLEPPAEHYRLEVRYDAAGPALEGSGFIRLSNTTSRPLTRLGLTWNATPQDPLTATIKGRSVTFHGTLPEPLQFELGEALSPGAQIEIGLRFRKLLPKPSAFGLIALRDWHPRLWWGYETRPLTT